MSKDKKEPEDKSERAFRVTIGDLYDLKKMLEEKRKQEKETT
jgi:hypothetical protein